jgi:hypothetical protein
MTGIKCMIYFQTPPKNMINRKGSDKNGEWKIMGSPAKSCVSSQTCGLRGCILHGNLLNTRFYWRPDLSAMVIRPYVGRVRERGAFFFRSSFFQKSKRKVQLHNNCFFSHCYIVIIYCIANVILIYSS